MPWEEGASNPSPERHTSAPPDGAPRPGFRPLSPSICHRPRAEAVSKWLDNCFLPLALPKSYCRAHLPSLLPPGRAPEIITKKGVIWVWAGKPCLPPGAVAVDLGVTQDCLPAPQPAKRDPTGHVGPRRGSRAGGDHLESDSHTSLFPGQPVSRAAAGEVSGTHGHLCATSVWSRCVCV